VARVDVVIGVLSKVDWRYLVDGCCGVSGWGGKGGCGKGDKMGIVGGGGFFSVGSGEVMRGVSGKGDVLGWIRRSRCGYPCIAR
jgi:hypothetical protein